MTRVAFPSLSQPPGTSRGPFRAIVASTCWLWPHATLSPQQLAQRENKGSSFSPFFRNLDSSLQKQPLGLVATMATGYPSLSNYGSPDRSASVSCARAPQPAAAPLTPGQRRMPTLSNDSCLPVPAPARNLSNLHRPSPPSRAHLSHQGPWLFICGL